MSWVGSPPRAVANYSREAPADATFVRGEVILTLAEAIAPGMTRQTERALPALIRLERGAAVEVHLPGGDGRCWTYRPHRTGRTTRWHLHAGAEFGGAAERVESLDGFEIERVVVQSVLPMAGTRRHVSFSIDGEGRATNLARATDPDPND